MSTYQHLAWLSNHDARRPSESCHQKPKASATSVSRARTGCQQCRKKKVKCDENRPGCGRCTRTCIPCSYQIILQWEDDAIVAGKSHGRAGVWSKQGNVHRARPSHTYTTASTTLAREGDASDNSVVSMSPSGSTQSSSYDASDIVFSNTSFEDMIIFYDDDRDSKHEAASDAMLENVERFKEGMFGSHLGKYLPTPFPGSISSISPWNPRDSENDAVLLSFFENVLCAKSILIDDYHHNVMRNAVLPIGLNSEVAYNAILMGAAHYLRLLDSKYQIIEIKMRQRTLIGLRNMLASNDWNADVLVVVVIMLCSLDISNSCSGVWTAHLTFYRDILEIGLEKFGGNPTLSSAMQLFSSYFSKHAILAKTLFSVEEIVPKARDALRFNGRERSSLQAPSTQNSWHYRQNDSWTSTDMISMSMPQGDLDVIDLWNGCSRSLLLLINEIAALKEHAKVLGAADISQAGVLRSVVGRTIQRLKNSIVSLSQRIPPTLCTNDIDDANPMIELLRDNAEAYRSAAMLLLDESSVPEFYGLPTNSTTTRLFQVISAEERASYILSILRIANDYIVKADVPLSWPLWPLFIAGCCTSDEEDKAVVLSLFRDAQQRKAYENIPRAQKLVELVWQQHDFSSTSTGARNRRWLKPGRYRWEDIMQRKGWTLSLA